MKKTAKAPAKKPALSTRGKVIIGGTAFVFVAIGVYLAKDKLFPKKIELPNTGTSTGTSAGTSKPSAASTGTSKPSAATTTPIPYAAGTLTKGSKGADVIRLQEFLNTKVSAGFLFGGTKKEAANPLLSTDGIFGSQTEAELLKQFGQAAITTKQLNKWIETGEKRLAQQA
jgi:hypothetical protein